MGGMWKMATLCRTEFLATEDLVVWFGVQASWAISWNTSGPIIPNPYTAKTTWTINTNDLSVTILKPDLSPYGSPYTPVPVSGIGFKITIPVADYVQGTWTIVGVSVDEFGNPVAEPQSIFASWGVAATATVAANDARAGQQLKELWDPTSKAMLFYADDGTTVVGFQETLDATGTPTDVWTNIRGRGPFTAGTL